MSTIAGIAAVAVALTGAAWYARKALGLGHPSSAVPMLQALYACFLERARATKLHDSQIDSHGDGLTATVTNDGGRKFLKNEPSTDGGGRPRTPASH